jgi:predicted nucleic acid-binding protein
MISSKPSVSAVPGPTKDGPIGPYDVLIAGQAVARNMILVTHNTEEFGRVPGLRIEDWQA